MIVSVPLYRRDAFRKKCCPEEAAGTFIAEYYAGEQFRAGDALRQRGGERRILERQRRYPAGTGMEIFVTGRRGTDAVCRPGIDNLGKGASGAAIQCLNILLGCEEDKGLCL